MKQLIYFKMAIFHYFPDMLLIILSLLVFVLSFMVIMKKPGSTFPTNWPVVGMLPGIFQNIHQIHDYMSQGLNECGGTFKVKGGLFRSLNMVIISNPVDIDYIFSKNFPNYPKGPEFKKAFEILGDGILTCDFEVGKFHRKTLTSYMSGAKFYSLLQGVVWGKVESGLLPVLHHLSENGIEYDLQNVFQRFNFDNACKLFLEHDSRSLSIDMPYVPCEKAFSDIMEPILHRYVVPEYIWKLQKWLKIGSEKKLLQATKTINEFIYSCVEKQLEVGGSTFIMALKDAYEETNPGSSKGLTKYLRDMLLNVTFAASDTSSTCLTWLFWLMSMNPLVEMKIFEEIQSKMEDIKKTGKNGRLFDVQDTNKLVYLHGALCESLRLFPPIAVEHKTPVQSDTLPSGYYVRESEKTVISFYAVGRMEKLWGRDYLEFKPERWINDQGGVKTEQAYNFPAFNLGPRDCIGKKMAFIQMKIVAAAVIHNFKIRPVEGHPVSPSSSVVIKAKQGLKVRLFKRRI